MTGIPAAARHRCDRGDARHYLHLNPGVDERDRLLAAAAEDEGVAAFQTHDVELAAELDQEPVDALLRESVAADPQRVLRNLVDELLGDQPVVDDGLAGAKQLEPSDGDQPRIARARPDERDCHGSRSATRAWKKSRRAS